MRWRGGPVARIEDGGGVYKQKLYRWQIAAACDDDGDDIRIPTEKLYQRPPPRFRRFSRHHAHINTSNLYTYIQNDLNFTLRRFSCVKIQDGKNAY